MSGITEDGCLASSDAATGRRLYDPAFKLFGRTIPVSSDCQGDRSGGQESRRAFADLSSIQHVDDETPHSEDESSVPEELGSSSGSNDGCDKEKMVADAAGGHPEDHVVLPEVVGATVTMHADDEQPGGKEARTLDQAPKRPDKPIHCPRCKSLETKFCYFNNYNVNQPRHFCKNCQRYWTAGGTLRNVPIGAGRRKNKHTGPHARSILPDVGMVRGDAPDNAQLSPNPVFLQSNGGLLKTGLPPPSNPRSSALPLNVHSHSSLESSPSGAVLRFGQESPVCISAGMASFTPSHRPEVLQGYKKPEAQGKCHIHGSMNSSRPSATISAALLEQNTADERNLKGQDAFFVANDEFGGASLLKPAARQAVGERPPPAAAEWSRPEEASAPINPEVGSSSEVPTKCVDAALAWASSAPFCFMGGGNWPYGSSLGWPNAQPATAQGGGCVVNPAAAPLVANLALAQNNASSLAAGANPAQAGVQPPPPWAAAAAMGPWAAAGGIPCWPLMQNPLWAPPGWGSAWTMPWAAPFTAAAAAAVAAAAAAAAASAVATAGPDPGSTILGKHPREQGEAEVVEKVLVPKTLRIDDPGDAARSSIWSTLGFGIGSDKFSAGGIFRDYGKPKAPDNNKERDDLHARARSSNPAGCDRSASFQENMLVSSTLDQATEQ